MRGESLSFSLLFPPSFLGFSQIGGAPQESKSGLIETDSFRTEAFSSGRLPAGPSSVANDTYPGSAPNRSAISFDHESPSSIDTRSADSTSHERLDASSWEQQATKKDSRRSSAKRKRPVSSATDAHMGDSHQLDAHNCVGDARKGKLFSKMGLPGPFPGVNAALEILES